MRDSAFPATNNYTKVGGSLLYRLLAGARGTKREGTDHGRKEGRGKHAEKKRRDWDRGWRREALNVPRVSRDFRAACTRPTTSRPPRGVLLPGPSPPPLTTTRSPSRSQPYLWEKSTLSRGRMNGGKSGGGGRFAAESFVGRIPCVGSIRCNNLLCHANDNPWIPSARESAAPTHTHTVERVHSCQSLPSWSIARAGSGEVSEIFVFSRRGRTP